MILKRKLNVSGYRGVWGETLTEEIVILYTRAFVRFTKEDSKKENPTILIGRDGRESGPQIRKIIIKELNSLNVNIVDGDIMPTPTVLFSVRKHKYDGAIIITASHNPIEYNGLKFVNKNALFTIEEEVKKINEYFEVEENLEMHPKEYIPLETPNFPKEHIDHILKNININAIKERKFKVVADMINASACVMDPYLFEQLGVELIPLNNIPNGKFAHRPEPLRENLEETMKVTREIKADIGFVHDPDADRLVIINEKGEVVSEEYSVVFGIENILSKNPGKPVVLNLSTSQMGSDIAKKYGSECYRSKIGEGYVVDKIISKNAIIGGEGNGGVIYPTINTCRDSFTALSLVLELLAERKQTVSKCIETMPKYFIKKDKWQIGEDLSKIYLTLKSHFANAKIDEQDGLRLDLPDGSWLHLRPSNTEPIIRLFGEAKTQERIDALFTETKLTLGLK
ncbi:MAG TPA: phosphoglucosamine mutase [Candidatus Paceibacterota bacterium]|nr:phosphoglucosamine mutase [Candidatus Paceibacterota bacterium]HPT18260.1 phosphoglucosamine mutase [Candidatus Paceibacterota bacterium]